VRDSKTFVKVRIMDDEEHIGLFDLWPPTDEETENANKIQTSFEYALAIISKSLKSSNQS
jgi:hypothetical protein